ncbi:MAG: hypothetical protein A2W23_00820 [Planctomycetes bacterium RBG_16_43_13]|nr:MAG: hypothetical protein A2W23_00820 [Planctomycetes bacterium RBG_16_43_13]
MSDNKIKDEVNKYVYPSEFAYARGEHVYFRYLTEEDAKGEWHLWFNSPEVTQYMGARRWFNTIDNQLEYLQYVKTTKDRLTLAIIDIKTNKHIGVCSLGSIDYINRHAEESCVIGDKKFQNGLYALESIAMITEIGFSRLNLHKIYATGAESNQNGLMLTKLLGYKESGRFKEHSFIKGKYEDSIILEILQVDWFKSPKRPKLMQLNYDE